MGPSPTIKAVEAEMEKFLEKEGYMAAVREQAGIAKLKRVACNYQVQTALQWYICKTIGLTGGGSAKAEWPRTKVIEVTRAPGTLDLVLQGQAGNQGVMMYVPEESEEEEATNDDGQFREVPEAIIKAFLDQGKVLLGGSWVFGPDSNEYKFLYRAFGASRDLNAYASSCLTPVLPGGWMPGLDCTVGILKDGKGRALGADGSGWYNPRHPFFLALAKALGWKKGEAHPVQIRAFGLEDAPEGEELERVIFAKGMLFPSDVCVDEQGRPAVQLDPGQFKGTEKKYAAGLKTLRIDIGVIRSFEAKAKIDWAGQVTENLNPKSEFACQWVAEQTRAAVKALIDRGAKGLIEDLAEESDRISMIVELCQSLKKFGINMDPMSVPLIREQVKEKLGRKGYHLQQGLGRSSDRYVVQIDETLEPGTCVIGGGRQVGSEVAMFRYPMLLPQGLKVMKVVEPSAHHLAFGKVPRWSILLNPVDITLGMQGDDDGDTVAVDDDPEVIKLFKECRLSEKVFLIEPDKASAVDLGMDHPSTRKGKEWIARDHKGPVGRLALSRSRFLAMSVLPVCVGLAIGTACLSQEAIDNGKRRSRSTDLELASIGKNWQKPQTKKFPTDYYVCCAPRLSAEAEFPLDSVLNKVKWAQKELGFIQKDDNGNVKFDWKGEPMLVDPLFWREKKKSVDISGWTIARAEEEEARHIRGMNLPQLGCIVAWRTWCELGGDMKLFTDVALEDPTEKILTLLAKLCSQESSMKKIQALSGWNQKRHDLFVAQEGWPGQWAKELGQGYNKSHDLPVENRNLERQRLVEGFRSKMDTLFTEKGRDAYLFAVGALFADGQWGTKPENFKCLKSRDEAVRQSNPTWAWVAVTGEDSPLRRILAETNETVEACKTRNDEIRHMMDVVVEEALKAADPVRFVLQYAKADGVHSLVAKGHIVQCKSCMDELWRSLILKTRESKGNLLSPNKEDLNCLVSKVNNQVKLIGFKIKPGTVPPADWKPPRKKVKW